MRMSSSPTCVTKNPDDNISEMKRATGDLLVAKRPDLWGQKFDFLISGFLDPVAIFRKIEKSQMAKSPDFSDFFGFKEIVFLDSVAISWKQKELVAKSRIFKKYSDSGFYILYFTLSGLYISHYILNSMEPTPIFLISDFIFYIPDFIFWILDFYILS